MCTAKVDSRPCPDGYIISVTSVHGAPLAEYSVDRMKNGQWLLYRSDKKPTTRTHRIVEFRDDNGMGFVSWLMDNQKKLKQEAGAS